MASESKENDENIMWDTASYNKASKKLYDAAIEDLSNFETNKHGIIDLKYAELHFPNISCPQIIITFNCTAPLYKCYPLKLEITYQYKTALMISSDKSIDFEQKQNAEIRLRPRMKCIINHCNVTQSGLFSNIQNKQTAHLQFDSLQNVFLSILYILVNPILPILPSNQLINAWKQHPIDSCKCHFYFAMPCSFKVFIESSQEKKQSLLNEFRTNINNQKMKTFDFEQLKINKAIKEYKPLHPQLFAAKDWNFSFFLDSEFLSAFKNKNTFVKFIKSQIQNRVFSFSFLSHSFCDLLVSEFKNYEETDSLPKDRPNSMNNYGVILNKIGLEPLMNELFERFLRPISQWIYPSDEKTAMNDFDFTFFGSLDHFHCFMVEYQMNADLFLDMHIDDSEVTFNINIFDEFEGAELAICGLTGEKQRRSHLLSYAHRKGHCLIHSGRQRHGARSITNGKRQNLIIWCRSSWQRMLFPHGSGKCACCRHSKENECDPDPICLSKTHDKDYKKWIGVYSEKEIVKNNFTIENEMNGGNYQQEGVVEKGN